MQGKNVLESLETRRLFSGAELSSTGVLFVHGNIDAANKIVVALSSDASRINVSIDSAKPNLPVKHWQGSFVAAKVLAQNIRGGEWADVIDVGQTGPKFTVKTRIDSLAGADVIRGGAENDLVYAGAGNDKVFAGGGADMVRGGLGDDEIHGGDGSDSLAGNEGNDKLFGDNGDDTLYGVVGVNGLFGGAGKDTFVVRSLTGQPNDFLAGTDILKIVPGPTGDLT